MRFKDLKESLKRYRDFEGYVQYISKPGVHRLEPGFEIEEKPNEMGLYSKDQQKSVMVRFINGEWFIDEVDVSDVLKDDIETFLSEVKGYKVRVAQIWEIESDPWCEGFEVQRFIKNVFMGFEKDSK